MLIPDLLLLTAALILVAWRLIAPQQRPAMRTGCAALLLLLAALHWALVDFTWQLLPAYLLLVVSALPPANTGAALRWIGRGVAVAIAAAAVGAWVLPAVPTLPPPDGRFAVGTAIHRWTDAARDEPHTADSHDRRSVIAQAWYPAPRRERPSDARRLPYIDGGDAMPPQVSGLPGFLLRRYDEVDSHAEHAAPLASRDRPWPVVIFSPGYGAPRAVYTGLATRLAARGFVVVVVDHPFESGVTQLPDGRVVGTQEHFPPGQPDRTRYMADQQRVRTADIRFVIDQLARPEQLAPALRGAAMAVSKVAVIGHSFGGAVSAMVMSEDERVVAAANIDGTPYGELPDRRLTRPFLLLQSDLDEAPHGPLFHDGNGKLLANMTAPGYRYELKRANHYSFTDALFFVAAPARWLLTPVIGGSRGPAETQAATADLLAAFLAGPLTGVDGDVEAAARRHPDVLGGAVRR